MVEQFGQDAEAPAEIAGESRAETECGSREVGRDWFGADQAGTGDQELETRLEGVRFRRAAR